MINVAKKCDKLAEHLKISKSSARAKRRACSLNEGEVNVHPAWSHGAQSEDHSHLLSLPVNVVAGAKSDSAYLDVGDRMTFFVKLLRHGKTGYPLLYTSILSTLQCLYSVL